MNNVVLIGFMGSGKTTVGRQLAARLQRSFIDLDRQIEAEAGRSVAEIFATEGEATFREYETRSLRRALHGEGAIIAAGGGAPLADSNWFAMREGNTTVCLMAEPAELVQRLTNGNGRPLLQADPATAIASLLPQRLARYLQADLVMTTDRRAPDEVAAEIERRLPRQGPVRIAVPIPGAAHQVVIGTNLSGMVASTVRTLQPSSPAILVTDETVFERHGELLREELASCGIATVVHTVPAGERAKAVAELTRLYDVLAGAAVDRQGLMLVLGGGTVGDVAGFAAATWMRGIRYVQLPTTLLAMVDSSIGGKTGINLAAGKNMVGAVHQPAAIFADLDYLATLPDDEFRAALAEVIKAALIVDRDFAAWLSKDMRSLLRREPCALQQAVSRAVAIKADVVARDPNEAGVRALLNYGHTVGHALERSLGYGRIRHGEAVAWGMEVAARLSLLTGRCTDEVAAAQHALLESAGLLENRPLVDRSQLLEALRHDKKSRRGQPRWVLLTGVGEASYGNTVEGEQVEAALSQVLHL